MTPGLAADETPKRSLALHHISKTETLIPMLRSLSELRWLLGCVLNHPANRRHRVRAVLRFAWWQLRKRLSQRPAVVRVGANRKFKVLCDSPFSSMVVYDGLPEWDEMKFLLRVLRASDGFIDIGANVGFYTVLASTVITEGPLFAFEANPRNLEVLRDQVQLNELANAEVFGNALGNTTGELSFFDSGRETGSIATEGDSGAKVITVPCRRLDDCLAGHSLPDYVVAKMDVEGCEALVLEGGTAAMQGGRISVWLFELNETALCKHGSSGEKLIEAFSTHGYSILYWDEEHRQLGTKGDGRDANRENYVACLDVEDLKGRLTSGLDTRSCSSE